MREAILDTSFVMDCVKEKVDFFDYFEKDGVKPIIPQEVIQEIERLSNESETKKIRDSAQLAKKMIEKNGFESPSIGKGHVDSKIKNLAKEKPASFLATMDKDLKYAVNNRKIVLKNGSKIEKI